MRITTDADDDWQPDWSPDGNSVVFRSERAGGGIYVAPINGGPEQRLADFGFRPTWSPDGATIVFARSVLGGASTGLHAVGRPGAVRPLSRTRPGAFGWLAPGEIFVLACRAGPFIPSAESIDVEGREVATWQVDAEVAHRFLQLKLSVEGSEPIRWVAGENAIFFIGNVQGFRSVWRIGVDRNARRIVTGPLPMTTSIEASNFSITGDGRRLAFGASRRAARLWSYALDASGKLQENTRTALAAEAVHTEAPDISRDGKRLVFTLARPASHQQRELVTRDMSTGQEQTRRVLDDDRGVMLFPRWSSDGTRLSYTLVPRPRRTTAPRRTVASVWGVEIPMRRQGKLESCRRISGRHAAEVNAREVTGASPGGNDVNRSIRRSWSRSDRLLHAVVRCSCRIKIAPLGTTPIEFGDPNHLSVA